MYGFCLFLIISQSKYQEVRGFFVGITVVGLRVTAVEGPDGITGGQGGVVDGDCSDVVGGATVTAVVVDSVVASVGGVVTAVLSVVGGNMGSVLVGGAVLIAIKRKIKCIHWQ